MVQDLREALLDAHVAKHAFGSNYLRTLGRPCTNKQAPLDLCEAYTTTVAGRGKSLVVYSNQIATQRKSRPGLEFLYRRNDSRAWFLCVRGGVRFGVKGLPSH